jgi:Fe-S oxidoreductase
MDIRMFVERAKSGLWTLAYKLFRNAVLFPSVVCEICPAPCETACQRTMIGDEAVNLRGIESASIRLAKSRVPESYRIPKKGKTVAVVGAGPAGLSFALNMAQKRYGVTVFDRAENFGGGLSAHPKIDLFREDIGLQFSNLDVAFEFGAEINSMGELSPYDAVFIATGKGGNDFGLLSGWNADTFMAEAAERIGVFMGGGLCGRDSLQAIADGAAASRMAESAIQTGRAPETENATRREPRVFDHSGEPLAPRIIPAGPEGYTGEEAANEAGRCMLCDCRRCMDSCEVLAAWSKRPQKIAVEAFLDLQANPPFSDRTLTREAYSCNLCGHCGRVCPVGIDMGDVFHLSRVSRMESGKYPEAFHDYWLRELDFVSENVACAIPPEIRAEGEGGGDDFGAGGAGYVFFPGCKLGGHTPSRVLGAFAFLRGHYCAGIVLDCCGAPAYWAGDEGRRIAHTEKLRGIWEGMGRPIFVVACPYCENLIGRFMPEVETVSLYELMSGHANPHPDCVGSGEKQRRAQSADAAMQNSRPLPSKASVFDPCASGRGGSAALAVRHLAAAAGVDVIELPDQGRCCGFGGHMRAANPGLYSEISKNRAKMGDAPYIVYCANCEDVFLRSGKDCVHAIDLAFGAPAEKRGGPVADLQAQRDNLSMLKADLLSSYTDGSAEPQPEPWDGVDVIISDGLVREMDDSLILKGDVREAIWRAESDGDMFMEQESGMCLCCLRKPIVTYWVRYRRASGGAYEVFDVYSHRMRIDEDS